MGLDHFQRFLYAFAEDYSESYEKLSELGDFFYLTDSERDFEKWLEQNGRSFCSERSKYNKQHDKEMTYYYDYVD